MSELRARAHRRSVSSSKQPSRSMAAMLGTSLCVWEEEDRLIVAERRVYSICRALFQTALAAAALALVVRLLYFAATLAPLWAIPAAGALILLIASVGGAVGNALDREIVVAVGDVLFIKDTRLRTRSIIAIRNDDDAIRVVCVGGARQIPLFRSFPRRERETAAHALRAALGVAEQADEQLPVLPQDSV